jgi:hypothetical protein
MEPTIQSIRIDYDRLAKLMGMLVATIYVVGVVVVNLRLAGFGITGMGLLREQYVFAGVWAVLPVLTISITVAMFCGFAIEMYRGEIAMRILRDKTEPTRRERIWAGTIATGKAAYGTLFVISIGGVIFTVSVNWALPGATTLVATTDVLLTSVEIAVFAAVTGGLAAAAVAIFRTTGNIWNYVLASASAMVTAILALGYLSFFAVSIYARIPPQFGGGADTKVKLLLNLDAARLAQIGLPGDGATSVRLLFVTNSVYYVISPNDPSRAVGIPSAAVIGIETLR